MTQPDPSQTVYQGKIFSVRKQPVPQPNGAIAMYDIVDHVDAVAIVALRAEAGEAEPLVALVHQSRPAVGQQTWEIPAGLMDDPEDGDDPEATARRELAEEIGYEAGNLRLLIREYSSAGFTNEKLWIYLATDLRALPAATAPDPFEITRVEWMPLSAAMERCLSDPVADSKTLIGLWLARDALTADEMSR